MFQIFVVIAYHLTNSSANIYYMFYIWNFFFLTEYKYLKDVEVVRPGRTTLDMKMEELKRKMEAHVAAEAEANKLRQVPPVTIQAPDLEQIKQSLSGKASSSKTNLSQLAAGMASANEINIIASTFIIWRDVCVCVCSLRSHGC